MRLDIERDEPGLAARAQYWRNFPCGQTNHGDFAGAASAFGRGTVMTSAIIDERPAGLTSPAIGLIFQSALV